MALTLAWSQELIAPSGVESVELGDAVCQSTTIFFSDIRDFTTITESMSVNEVMEFLNTYLAFAVPAITEVDPLPNCLPFAHPSIRPSLRPFSRQPCGRCRRTALWTSS